MNLIYFHSLLICWFKKRKRLKIVLPVGHTQHNKQYFIIIMLYYNYIAFCIAIFLYCFLHAVIFFLLVCFGIESRHMYMVMGKTGRKIFSVNEEEKEDSCQCCDSKHSFIMHVTDITGYHVITLIRTVVSNLPIPEVLGLYTICSYLKVQSAILATVCCYLTSTATSPPFLCFQINVLIGWSCL